MANLEKTQEQNGYQATPEQIAQWKSKHGDVFKISVDGRNAYLKKPDRNTLSMASAVGTKDPMQFNEIILKNCWLEGDVEIQTNDELFLAASSILEQLIVIKEATLEKL